MTSGLKTWSKTLEDSKTQCLPLGRLSFVLQGGRAHTNFVTWSFPSFLILISSELQPR